MISVMKGSHHMSQQLNQHFAVSKDDGIQRRTLESPLRMHFTCCSMPKGTSWAEVA